MNQPRKSKRLFGTLSIIGLILIIALFFAIQLRMNSPAVMATATQFIASTSSPYVAVSQPAPVGTIIPLITPTANTSVTTTNGPSSAKEPPSCTFPLAQTTTAESAPENYTFSEPRVVLTDPNPGFFNVFEWLPDSQRILIMREVVIKARAQYQSIELFTPRTIKVQIYSGRSLGYDAPMWVAGLNAAIYQETVLLSASYDKYKNVIPTSAVLRKVLWLSQGNPADAQPLEEAVLPYSNVVNPSGDSKTFSTVAVKPDGSQIILLRGDGKQLIQFKVSQGLLGKV